MDEDTNSNVTAETGEAGTPDEGGAAGESTGNQNEALVAAFKGALEPLSQQIEGLNRMLANQSQPQQPAPVHQQPPPQDAGDDIPALDPSGTNALEIIGMLRERASKPATDSKLQERVQQLEQAAFALMDERIVDRAAATYPDDGIRQLAPPVVAYVLNKVKGDPSLKQEAPEAVFKRHLDATRTEFNLPKPEGAKPPANLSPSSQGADSEGTASEGRVTPEAGMRPPGMGHADWTDEDFAAYMKSQGRQGSQALIDKWAKDRA